MATAAVPSSNLLHLVHCELCLEKYNDSDRLPKLLNCSHTFCLACVQRYYESKLRSKLTCPNCRELFTIPFAGIQKLKTNIVVVDLLDQLAPFSADDGDDDVAEASTAPQNNILEEPGLTICSLHPGEKCDFYCEDCRDPMCHDCIVSQGEGPHKTHKIRKLRDVLTTYSAQHKDAVQLVTNMKSDSKQRTEELLEELALSRDSLMKMAKSKRDKTHQEADRWYQNTTASISQVYDKLHAQILQLMSKSDLQELQQYLDEIDLKKIDGDLKQAQRFLGQLQSSVTSFKTSIVWPTNVWSVDVGKITDEFTVDLGNLAEPTLNLPDVNSFPYTIEPMLDITEIAKPKVRKQTQNQPGDKPLLPDCTGGISKTSLAAVDEESAVEGPTYPLGPSKHQSKKQKKQARKDAKKKGSNRVMLDTKVASTEDQSQQPEGSQPRSDSTVTKPTLTLPDVNSFHYRFEKLHENTSVIKPRVKMQSQTQPRFVLLSDLPMQPGCNIRVGLTTSEAVVCFKGQSVIKKIKFGGDQSIVSNQSALPHNISESCEKYILKGNFPMYGTKGVLLRECNKGPSYILNLNLGLVSTIHEEYGSLIGADGGWAAFEDGSIIHIYHLERKCLQRKLTRPAGARWSGASICQHPESRFTAVVDSSRSLCIYNNYGSRLHTNYLRVQPRASHAIACNRRHVYVVSEYPASVLVLSWRAQLVTMLDTQQLRIPDGQEISNIAVDENQFAITVGPGVGSHVSSGVVSSVKTFQCVYT